VYRQVKSLLSLPIRFVYERETSAAKPTDNDFIHGTHTLGPKLQIWRLLLRLPLPRLSHIFRIFMLFLVSTSLAACVSTQRPDNRPRQQTANKPTARPSVYAPTPPARPQGISPALDSYIGDQWRQFPGKTGIAVLKIDGGGLIGRRLDDYFPQQSVSKMWVALTVLEQVDQGRLRLDQNVRITPDDVAVFHQPLGDRVTGEGEVNETVGRLIELAITTSDNTANDSLLRTAGGPQAVNAFIAKHGLGQIRFGPGERLLQSGIAGLQWNQKYSVGRRFYAARDELPYAQRKAALDSYLADPVDGASPRAIANALARLTKGELLSPASTRLILSFMGRVTSGPNRLKAGVPYGWSFGHKTGTGQILSSVSTGYNDIGIMTAPDGIRYAVVVLIADTTASVPDRMQFMQSISRAVADYHR
jgi:beta-lactamase class A